MQSKFIFISILFILSSCNNTPDELTKKISESTDIITKSLEQKISNLAEDPSQPIEEVKKLSQLEYKVTIFPLETTAKEMEEELTKLGKERWDCSSIFPTPRPQDPRTNTNSKPEILAICKRTPETVLRFIPKSILGR